jgi:hypothetical protein
LTEQFLKRAGPWHKLHQDCGLHLFFQRDAIGQRLQAQAFRLLFRQACCVIAHFATQQERWQERE